MKLNVYIVGVSTGLVGLNAAPPTANIMSLTAEDIFVGPLDEGYVIIANENHSIVGDVSFVTSVLVTTVSEARAARLNAVAGSIAGVVQITRI